MSEKKVIIELRGGIPYIVYKSYGIHLELRDYDNSYPMPDDDDTELLKEIEDTGLEIDEGGRVMDRTVQTVDEATIFHEYYHVFTDNRDASFPIEDKERAWKLFHDWCKEYPNVRIYYIRDDENGREIHQDHLGGKGDYPA